MAMVSLTAIEWKVQQRFEIWDLKSKSYRFSSGPAPSKGEKGEGWMIEAEDQIIVLLVSQYNLNDYVGLNSWSMSLS